MASDRANDPRAFREFLDAKLSNGEEAASLDEILGLWAIENQAEEEREETDRAIQRGLDDVDAGRTRPAEEALRELCRKHGLPDPR